MRDSENKWYRILHMYISLAKGESINKRDIAKKYQVSEKSIQRDIEALRRFGGEENPFINIAYDKNRKGYILNKDTHIWLQKKEVLSITKILLESRAFTKNEMENLIRKLILQTSKDSRKYIEERLKNELHHYSELQHKKSLIDDIWSISEAIKNKRVISLTYKREGMKDSKTRNIYPVGILFSEYYFYLVAFLEGKSYDFPTIYRLDRIQDCKIKNETFNIPEKFRFEEGEYRKKIPFMQSGEIFKVKLHFWGESIEAVLDRLPNARILSKNHDEKGIKLEAEVFGRGIKMWILSQMPKIEVLYPDDLRAEIKKILEEGLLTYK